MRNRRWSIAAANRTDLGVVRRHPGTGDGDTGTNSDDPDGRTGSADVLDEDRNGIIAVHGCS
jgi:hypothetical protein